MMRIRFLAHQGVAKIADVVPLNDTVVSGVCYQVNRLLLEPRKSPFLEARSTEPRESTFLSRTLNPWEASLHYFLEMCMVKHAGKRSAKVCCAILAFFWNLPWGHRSSQIKETRSGKRRVLLVYRKAFSISKRIPSK